MSNTSGALGFVQGLQGGMDFMDKRRRNKAIDKSIAQDTYLNEIDIASRKKDFVNEGGDPDKWLEFDDPTLDDPLMVRGFNWLKSKFGKAPKDDTVAGLAEEPDLGGGMASPTYMNKMADGGRPRAIPSAMDSMDIRGGYRSQALRDEDENLAPRPVEDEELFPRTRDVTEGYNMTADELAQRSAAAGTAHEKGDIARQRVGNRLGQVGSTVAAYGRDLVDAAIPDSAVDYLKGFVGQHGTRENRQTDPTTPPAGKEETPVTQAIQAATDGEGTDKGTAAKAINAAVEMTPGHPDNPNQAFDWAEVSASGVRPEDVPPAPTEDWAKYRRNAAQAAAMRGESPQAKQDEITKMQINGFTANSQQAAFLLKQGDARGAALAMRMAYNYFPNGSDVRFGIADGKNGPVLVGMGVDEKTGEPVGDGTPMLLTPDTMMMYADAAQDPNKWLAWTKDWHEMAQKDRQYSEIDKPQAQAELDLTAARTDANYASAERDRAITRSGGSGAGGPKQADARASLKAGAERLFGNVEQDDQIAMEALFERLRQAYPDVYQLGDAQIVDMILKAYGSDDFTEIQKLLEQ